MNLAPPQGFDSKLIVFLNYQELFLVFSKTSIDIYDRHLARKASYSQGSGYSEIGEELSLRRQHLREHRVYF